MGAHMPPVILWVLGAAGAAVLAKWVAKETRRINAELDTVKAKVVEPVAEPNSKLVRDPVTGHFRPERRG
jgi:hypothetical protein